MDRTVRILLKPTIEQASALRETVRQFTESFNTVCRVGWEQRNGNAFTLHRLTYRDCKNALPNLVSDLHIQARQKAAEAIQSAIAREKKGLKTGCLNRWVPLLVTTCTLLFWLGRRASRISRQPGAG